MNEVYIDMRKENEWIRKHFTKDLVSIEDLLGCIEDLDGEVERLQEELETKEEFIAQMQGELKVYDPFNYGD